MKRVVSSDDLKYYEDLNIDHILDEIYTSERKPTIEDYLQRGKIDFQLKKALFAIRLSALIKRKQAEQEQVKREQVDIGKSIPKISLEDIAKELETQKSSISNYSNGKAEPKASTIYSLSEYFNVSADYLLGLTDTKTINPTKKSACEYTGLSDAAVDNLHKHYNDNDEDTRLFMTVASHLIKEGFFEKLVQKIVNGLISGCQYQMLYCDNPEQYKTMLDTQEYSFNQAMTDAYRQAIEFLYKHDMSYIKKLAVERFYQMEEAAIETKERMENILEFLQSPELQTQDAQRINQLVEKTNNQ